MWPETRGTVYPQPPFYPTIHPAMAAAVAAERSSSKRALFIAAAMFFALALVGTVSVVIVAARRAGVSAAAADGNAPIAAATPATAFDTAAVALDKQAAALIKGDETAWLAAVDPAQPKLQARYRSMYASLRGLGVSQFEYHPYIRASKGEAATTVAMGADISYCFSMDTCPGYSDSSPWSGAPRISQALTLKLVGGSYVITDLGKAAEPNHLQPTPWESGDLVFAQGKRVTVAGAPSQAKHLEQVAALADKAASVADRVAGFVGNPQQRYRVFIADNKSWRSWYGGESGKWTTGLEIPLNRAQSDVVLKMSALRDRAELARTLQHELGHVATVGGATEENDFLYRENQWLSEGVAEYVEWSPRGATASYRRTSVRLAVRGSHRPKSIVAKPLSANASDRTIDAFYGLGHFAVDCMAQEFGQRKMFDFIRLRLRLGEDLDRAARHAYGMPFATVDKACVAWIRQRA